MKNIIKLCSLCFILPLLFFTSLLLTPSFAAAAVFPLEITNIKPAGTGTPAIPPTNRIFRAYPGIEYNIRAAVIGGLYPFLYELENAPVGMTIDSFTGEINWPNPQNDAGPITLKVTDSEGTTVSTSWSINVSPSGFIFVDASYSGTETGSISQPYSSIANLINNTGSENRTNMVYFRAGEYAIPAGEVNEQYSIRNSPHTWLGYPGEIININNNQRPFRTDNSMYLDNLRFHNAARQSFMLWGGHHYQTMRRCLWDGLYNINTINQNSGFLFFTSSPGNPGFYSVIQDNEFRNYTGGLAIGSIYDMHKLLIENNYIHGDGGYTATGGFNSAIGAKYRHDRLTVRGNKIIRSTGGVFLASNANSSMVGADGIEVSFNLFYREDGGANSSNFRSWVDNPATNIYFYRNTLIGYITFAVIDGNDCTLPGDLHVYDNVLINDNQSDWSREMVDFIGYNKQYTSNNPENCIYDNNNLKVLPEKNVVDSNGYLTKEFEKYRGTHGHQIFNADYLPKVENFRRIAK